MSVRGDRPGACEKVDAMTDIPFMHEADMARLHSAIEMVERTGAQNFEVGYLNEDAKRMQDADWFATARFRGTMVKTEHHASPVTAAETLMTLLMRDAKCRFCDRKISWGRAELKKRCLWRQVDGRWLRGCTDTHPEPLAKYQPGDIQMYPEAEPLQDDGQRPLPTKVSGQHRWLAFVTYSLTDEEAETAMTSGGEKVMLDERRRIDVMVGCWDCEGTYGDGRGKPCPAEAKDEG